MQSLMILALCFAQPPPAPATCRLQDGSLIYLSLHQPDLEVLTRYGKLTIPLKDIRSIELGSHFLDPAKMGQSFKDLSSQSHAARDAAQRWLQAQPPTVYPLLLEVAKSEDVEARRRGELLVRHFQASYPKDRLKASRDDIVMTDDLRINGVIQCKSLKANSVHLGDLDLKLADLREVRFQAVGLELTVNATGEWHDAGMVTRGCRLSLTADGSVECWPTAPGQYLCGPKGLTGTAGKGGAFIAGALLGKIGDGNGFIVGEAWGGEIQAGGRLWLKVMEAPWGQASAGSFNVKIRVE